MQLVDRLGELPLSPVTIDLDDIQATVLRYRPEPYYGTHVMLHVEDARDGREFVRRLAPMSTPPPSGGERARPGPRSPSATPAWLPWACRRTRWTAFPKPSASGWPNAPTSSGTTG